MIGDFEVEDKRLLNRLYQFLDGFAAMHADTQAAIGALDKADRRAAAILKKSRAMISPKY